MSIYSSRYLGQSNAGFELDDPPYTAPEDDPFHITPLLSQPRRRRSSMLNKWIQDQQTAPTDAVDVNEQPSIPASRSHPYLAYPELATVHLDASSSSASLNSYDLLEDDDIPQQVDVPLTPTIKKNSSRPGSKMFQTPPSFRALLPKGPFRSASNPATPLGTTSSGNPTPGSTQMSFFPRTSRSSSGSTAAQHKKSSSLSTLSAFLASNDTEPIVTPSKSRWRPSVLGHFGISTSQPSIHTTETQSTHAPRPSISSNTTYTTTTQTDSDYPATPPLSAAGSSRDRHRSYGSLMQLADNNPSSSFSVWSGPSYLDELNEFSSRAGRGPNSTISCDGYIGMPQPRTSLSVRAFSAMSRDGFVDGIPPPRVPLAPKPNPNKNVDLRSIKQENRPEIAYSPGSSKSRTLPRVSFAALGPRKKKKTLVISGISAVDTRKFEAAKRWCESFGELLQIVRMPNGDLHVHFRNAEVADTVCRVRAKVYIRGVGSVQLSWCTGVENIR
ncbi:hypothetical protein MIND_00504700 [Mycena indigotica]|uniref:RRM domain-containing protein n=1 Tax=Mycena indigotica TaxID=2126181 RepID=A0A8H6W9Y3_9AGAR|nr:uncharacterized protein MIND_00504700 [Mycena indigotica]KAF7307113.1 hypothetical protein MIND_00504700 [Mycena indigotica]